MENKNQFFLKDIRLHRNRYPVKNMLTELSYALTDMKEMLPKSPMTEAATKLNEEIGVQLSQYDKAYNDKFNKLKETIGKYWEVTKYGGNNNEDNYGTRLIYPYRLIGINSTYWYIEGIVDDDYNSGMRSMTSNVNDELFNNCQFVEITKEEFIRRIKAHVTDVLNTRLEKIENSDEDAIY
jgi:hypothetical protein